MTRDETISHMILLRRCDAEYARWRYQQYTKQENCPYPDIGPNLTERWAALSLEDQAAPWMKRSKPPADGSLKAEDET